MPKPKTDSKVSRYLILPARGLRTNANHDGYKFLDSLSKSVGKMTAAEFSLDVAPRQPKIKVLGSIHENGAKLVELAKDQMIRLRLSEPGIRIVPEVTYQLAFVPYPSLARKQAAGRHTARAAAAGLAEAVKTAPAGPVTITVTGNGNPVKGVKVIAFTNFAQRAGAQGVTNATGVVKLNLPAVKIERLIALPEIGFWPFMRKNVTLSAANDIALPPLDFSVDDCVRHFYGRADLDAGSGVTVGIIDCGIADHPDLVLDGGENTVTGESKDDFGDNGMEGHGTHVAGIVAARGSAPTGTRGVAPGVTLRSYRVFGQGQKGASNFAIAKAIDTAVADGCDLINMSLGGGAQDPATDDAVSAAREAGVVVLAANGNDSRHPVSFPAAFDLCLAVSAMGRKDALPANTATQDRVASPFGIDPNDFVASFSNIGEDTDLTGPGVGVISTVPSGYTIMDGTSMACPAATGALARQLAQHPEILSMSRDQARSNAIVGLLGSIAAPLGFGAIFEGAGLIKG